MKNFLCGSKTCCFVETEHDILAHSVRVIVELVEHEPMTVGMEHCKAEVRITTKILHLFSEG